MQDPFCILPRYSYFGEYEVLYDEPADYFFKAIGDNDFDIYRFEENQNNAAVISEEFI